MDTNQSMNNITVRRRSSSASVSKGSESKESSSKGAEPKVALPAYRSRDLPAHLDPTVPVLNDEQVAELVKMCHDVYERAAPFMDILKLQRGKARDFTNSILATFVFAAEAVVKREESIKMGIK